MIKSYLKTIVRRGIGKLGIGLEMFRLDADEAELTELEQEAIEEDGGELASTALIRVYEQIGENFWDGSGMSVKKFAEALDELGSVKKLNIHINSLGGDTHTSQAIYNLIGDYDADTTSYIDGVAASAATIVASGAQKVVMRKNANYMIHNPWTLTMGNANALRKAAEDLDQVTEPIIAVYKEQTGNKTSRAKIIELMDEETWLTASEALDYGFVDEVRGKGNAIASAGKGKLFINGTVYNIARYGYHNVPNFPTILNPELKVKKPESKHKMTLKELEQVDPDLVASIRADASKEEQIRLAALNAMMAPGLEAIINKAIEDGSTPASIAMECFNVVKENNASAERVNQLKRDAAPVSNIPASDAPVSPPKKENKPAQVVAKAFQADPRQAARAKQNGRLMLS
jgi:ATP-dependent Clp protease, protease subunit